MEKSPWEKFSTSAKIILTNLTIVCAQFRRLLYLEHNFASPPSKIEKMDYIAELSHGSGLPVIL